MAVPSFISDGDTNVITQDGPGWFTEPFADRGDTDSFEWHCYYTQHASSYTSYTNGTAYSPSFIGHFEVMPSISTTRGTAYLYKEDEPTEVNNTGLLRFLRHHCSIPETRIEPTSLIYSRQFLAQQAEYTWESPPAAPEVQEIACPLDGYRKFEYFNGTLPTQLYAGRIAVIFGTPLKIGVWPPTYTAPFVAEDSKRYIYKGAIVCRETLYAEWPTTTAF